jgi:hypothetical protein
MKFLGLRISVAPVLSIFSLAILAGCATTSNVKTIDRLAAVDEDNPTILVMTPDIKYYLLTASGIPEPHAEWTTAARSNFQTALEKYADERQIEIQTIADPSLIGDEEIAYQKLYSAVGTTILTHHLGMVPLPTKNGSFDWSMGPDIKVIGQKYDADYALFSYYRDYQASGGRVAFAILAAAAGIGISTGSEGGFASLIDLRTGDIVWFNKVVAGVGELRDEKGAEAAVGALFKDMPEG